MERLPTILADLIGPGPTKDQLLETALNDRITLTAGIGLATTLMAIVIICGVAKLLEREGRGQRLPKGRKMAVLAIATSVAIGACAGFTTWQAARPQAKEGLYDAGPGGSATSSSDKYVFLDGQWYHLCPKERSFGTSATAVDEAQLPTNLKEFPDICLKYECQTKAEKQNLANEYGIIHNTTRESLTKQ